MKPLDEHNVIEYILEGLHNSKTRIWISSPWVNTSLIDREITCSDAKLVVRLDNKKANSITALQALSTKGPWEIRYNKNLHAKLYIFDDFCIIGSSNLTLCGTGKTKNPNIEASIYVNSSNDVEEFANRFKGIWEKSQSIQSFNNYNDEFRPIKRRFKRILRRLKPQDPFRRFKFR